MYKCHYRNSVKMPCIWIGSSPPVDICFLQCSVRISGEECHSTDSALRDWTYSNMQLSFNSMELFVRSWSPRISTGWQLIFPLVVHARRQSFESEWRANYFDSARVKLILAPLGMPTWVDPQWTNVKCFFVQTSTLPPSMHKQLTENGKCYQLSIKRHVEWEDK